MLDETSKVTRINAIYWLIVVVLGVLLTVGGRLLQTNLYPNANNDEAGLMIDVPRKMRLWMISGWSNGSCSASGEYP